MGSSVEVAIGNILSPAFTEVDITTILYIPPMVIVPILHQHLKYFTSDQTGASSPSEQIKVVKVSVCQNSSQIYIDTTTNIL